MLLRNKKTGQKGNFIIDKNHFECVDLDYVPFYFSLSELLDEWEDYHPKEPLIKDEKIRKAVRAVANITGVSMLFYEYYEDNETIQLSDMNGQILAFKSKKLSVKDFDSYTIEELCGEEE